VDPNGVKRRLAAIVSADVAGYSRLMGADEAGTLSQLKAHRAELLEPKADENGGRIVKSTGDGLLLEFASAVDAVRWAAEVQRAMAERNAEVAPERRLDFRVGVNLGDVIVEGDDIYGDGVNVAARLQELAEPGGLCVSGKVHEEATGRLDLGFADDGEQRVKNIARPLRVWRWRPGGQVPAKTSAAAARPSIAVLPFENMSGDEEQEYFADGIAEDIITALSRMRWFFVIARNSTFTFKGKAVDVTEVGRELGARYVLEGSVRRAGDRVRINAQLIDADSGNHLWAKRYDRQIEDVFALQDELTETIVGAIEPELGKVERQRARAKKPDSLDAWELYQQGVWHMHRRTAEDLAEAQGLFRRALEFDPELAAAYAGSAEAHFFDVVSGHAERPAESLEAALAAARRAADLDPEDPGAHYALGRAHTLRREHDLALPELEAAIELNPSYAQAHYALGHALATSGRPAEAFAPLEEAMRLSPHDPYIGQFMVRLSEAHQFLGHYEEAAEWARRSLRQPNVQWSRHAALVSALGHLGWAEEGERALAVLMAFRPDFSADFVRERHPIQDSRSMDHYLEGLRKAGLERPGRRL